MSPDERCAELEKRLAAVEALLAGVKMRHLAEEYALVWRGGFPALSRSSSGRRQRHCRRHSPSKDGP